MVMGRCGRMWVEGDASGLSGTEVVAGGGQMKEPQWRGTGDRAGGRTKRRLW